MPRSRTLRPKDVRRLAVLAIALLLVGAVVLGVTHNGLVVLLVTLALAAPALLWLPAFAYLRARLVPSWMRSRRSKMRAHMSAYFRE